MELSIASIEAQKKPRDVTWWCREKKPNTISSSLPITGRRLIPPAMTNKPTFKDTNQIIQTLDAEVSMLMVLQVAVPVIQEQYGGCTGCVASCHVVDAIADLVYVN